MAEPTLEDTTWQLVRYDSDGSLTEANSTRQATLRFENGKFSGSAGCNRYFGAFEQTDDGIAFGPAASTRRACPAPDGIMKQETRYLQALETVSSYRIDVDKLELLKSDGKVAAHYRAADPAEAE